MSYNIICFNEIKYAKDGKLKRFLSDQSDLYNLFDRVLGFSKEIKQGNVLILREDFEQYSNLRELLLYSTKLPDELVYEKIVNIIKSFIRSLYGPAKKKTKFVYGILFNPKNEKQDSKFLLFQTINQLSLSQKLDEKTRKILYSIKEKSDIDYANIYRYALFWYDKDSKKIKFIAKEKWQHTKGFTEWLKVDINSLFSIIENFNIHIYAYIYPLQNRKIILQISEDDLYEEFRRKESIIPNYEDNIILLKTENSKITLRIEKIVIYPIRYIIKNLIDLEDFIIKRKHNLEFSEYQYNTLKKKNKNQPFSGQERLYELVIRLKDKETTIKKPDLRDKNIIPILSSFKDYIIFGEDILKTSIEFLNNFKLKLLHLLEKISDINSDPFLKVCNIELYNKINLDKNRKILELLKELDEFYNKITDENLRFIIKLIVLDLIKNIVPNLRNFIEQLLYYILNNRNIPKMYFITGIGESKILEYKRPDLLYNKSKEELYREFLELFNKKLKRNDQCIIIIGFDEQTHQPVIINSGYISEDLIYEVIEKIKNEEKFGINYYLIPVHGKYLIKKNNRFEISEDEQEGKILIIHIYKS